MNTDNVTEILNELIQTSKDGEQGFRRSAEDCRHPELKDFFYEGAARCAEAVGELQREVVARGGDPQDSGSLLGAAHRGWVDLKATVTGRDDFAILDECERGEDFARSRYEEALKADLSPEVRTLVERQYHGLLANYREVQQWRERLRSVQPFDKGPTTSGVSARY